MNETNQHVQVINPFGCHYQHQQSVTLPEPSVDPPERAMSLGITSPQRPHRLIRSPHCRLSPRAERHDDDGAYIICISSLVFFHIAENCRLL